MDIAQRIAQFENMVQADPTNDMAHFSLGNAYTQAGRPLDAAKSYLRCTELNPDMSKAYQLAGAAYIAAGEKGKAGDVLTEGYKVAADRGDRMPMKAMGELLESLGLPVPQVAQKQAEAPAGDMFVCSRTGRPGSRMARPPFRGPVGEWIQQHITRETFDDWIRQGTKVINELRLDLSRDQDSDTYDQHMREFLGIDDALYAQLTAKK
jgi:Fe-S cluster biosynthesis and repair protein YggX